MNTKIRLSLIFLVFIFLLPDKMNAQEKLLTLHDLIPGGKTNHRFIPRNLKQLQWSGDHYLYQKGDSLLCGIPGKKEEVAFTRTELNDILSGAGLQTVGTMPTFTVPQKEKTILVFTSHQKQIHYNYKEKKITATYQLSNEWSNYDYSPQNGYIAYTEGNNLYLLSPENKSISISDSTEEGVVYGQSVHQHEFGIRKGTSWSPKGSLLAFYRMDESMVTDYPLVDINTRIATEQPFKYPMAGMKSHEVTVGIYNPVTNETIYLKTGLPKEKYLTNMAWSPDEKSIYIAELNRDQNECNLVQYNAITGERENILFTEKHTKYVEPQNSILFLPNDPSKFIWQSQRDGYNHLYLYDTTGKELKQLTSGKWVVTDVLGFDLKGENLFYRSTAIPSVLFLGLNTGMEIHGWKINIRSGKQTALTTDPGVHMISPNASGNYIIDHYSSSEVPRKIEITSTGNGKKQLLLEAKDPFREYKMPEITSGQIKAADGITELNYRLVKPTNMVEGKKYPVIIYVYGGPHAQMINNSWQFAVRGWDIYMAQSGYVVFSVDGRGSANRGFDFESTIFRQLGKNEMEDQLKGVDFLSSLPYIDTDRIGVHGWSYGGFMTTNLLLTYPEIFKVGVAGGPVIDWSYYEIMYGERYMDHPKDNPEGYKASNLNEKAANLTGHLLLIHGDMDPVVVWQHSLSFLKACIEADTYPDYFVYPGHGHNVIGKDRPHLHEKITRYFKDYL